MLKSVYEESVEAWRQSTLIYPRPRFRPPRHQSISDNSQLPKQARLFAEYGCEARQDRFLSCCRETESAN